MAKDQQGENKLSSRKKSRQCFSEPKTKKYLGNSKKNKNNEECFSNKLWKTKQKNKNKNLVMQKKQWETTHYRGNAKTNQQIEECVRKTNTNQKHQNKNLGKTNKTIEEKKHCKHKNTKKQSLEVLLGASPCDEDFQGLFLCFWVFTLFLFLFSFVVWFYLFVLVFHWFPWNILHLFGFVWVA